MPLTPEQEARLAELEAKAVPTTSGLTPEQEKRLAELEAKAGGAPVMESAPATLPEPSLLESAARGAAQGASFGFQDEMAGLMASKLVDPIASRLIPGYEPESYSQSRDYFRAQNTSAKEANPWTYGLSQIPGAIASAPAVVVGGPVTSAAVGGGLYGAGTSESESILGTAGDAVTGAALAALTSGIMGKVGDWTKGHAEMQGGKALGATARQLRDPEKVKELGRWGLDSKVIRFGRGSEAMLDKAEMAAEEAAKNMGIAHAAVDKQGKFIQPKQLASDVTAKWLTPGRKESGALLDPSITNLLARPEAESISTAAAQALKEEAGSLARFDSLKSTSLIDQAKITYGTIKQAIEEAVEKRLGGQALADYQAAKHTYGMASEASQLLAAKTGRDLNRPVVGLMDLVAAAGSGPGGYAVKKAAVLASRPSSSMATTLDMLGNSMQSPKGPIALGPATSSLAGSAVSYVMKQFPQSVPPEYTKILMQADAQGQFEEAHATLMQSEPGYAQAVSELQNTLRSDPQARSMMRQQLNSDPTLSEAEKARQLSELNGGKF